MKYIRFCALYLRINLTSLNDVIFVGTVVTFMMKSFL